jgi:multimeric flavodoxin WrbA
MKKYMRSINIIKGETTMKVLLLNGSPRPNGCTARALREMEKVFVAEGVEVEFITVGNKDIRGCIACGSCHRKGECVFDDLVNEVAAKFEEADGVVFGSPVYYAHANGTMLCFLDRLFYSSHFDKSMKVGASVVSCRRAGTTSAFDDLNKYFTISKMPIASANYWNEVHGSTAEDVEKDKEGLMTMRNLARNMTFLMKAMSLGKEKYGLPENESGFRTNFADGLEP